MPFVAPTFGLPFSRSCVHRITTQHHLRSLPPMWNEDGTCCSQATLQLTTRYPSIDQDLTYRGDNTMVVAKENIHVNRSDVKPLINSMSCRNANHIVPTYTDVLLGRGRRTYEWEGNVSFTKMISNHVPIYALAKTNKEKVQITLQIIELVKNNGGRFIAMDSSSGEFYEVSDADARMKVSQALRHRRSLEKQKKKSKVCENPSSTHGKHEKSEKTGENTTEKILKPKSSDPCRMTLLGEKYMADRSRWNNADLGVDEKAEATDSPAMRFEHQMAPESPLVLSDFPPSAEELEGLDMEEAPNFSLFD